MSIIDLRRNGSRRVPPDEHVRPRAPGHHPSAQRIARQHLLPFAIIGSALLAVYSVAAAVYAPHLFSSYATRYGAAVAMISALFRDTVIDPRHQQATPDRPPPARRHGVDQLLQRV